MLCFGSQKAPRAHPWPFPVSEPVPVDKSCGWSWKQSAVLMDVIFVILNRWHITVGIQEQPAAQGDVHRFLRVSAKGGLSNDVTFNLIFYHSFLLSHYPTKQNDFQSFMFKSTFKSRLWSFIGCHSALQKNLDILINFRLFWFCLTHSTQSRVWLESWRNQNMCTFKCN